MDPFFDCLFGDHLVIFSFRLDLVGVPSWLEELLSLDWSFALNRYESFQYMLLFVLLVLSELSIAPIFFNFSLVYVGDHPVLSLRSLLLTACRRSSSTL